MGCAGGIVANGTTMQMSELVKIGNNMQKGEGENYERDSNVEIYLDENEDKNKKKEASNVRKVKIPTTEIGVIFLKMNIDAKKETNAGKAEKDSLLGESEKISNTCGDEEAKCQRFESLHSDLLLKLTDLTFFPTKHQRNLLANYAGSVRRLATANKQAELYPLAISQLTFYLQILRKIENKIDVNHQINIEREMGWMHFRIGNYNEAATLYQKCLKSIKNSGGKQSEDYEVTLQALADVNYQRGHLTACLENLQQCLEIEEKRTGKGVVYAELIHKLGKVYNKQGNYQKALKQYGRALQIKQKAIGERQNLGCLQVLGSIGNTHFNMNNYAQSIKFHSECVSICEKQSLQPEDYALANFCLGSAHLKLMNYSKALDFFLKARDYYHQKSKIYLSLLAKMALCYQFMEDRDKYQIFTTQILKEAIYLI